MTSHDNPETAAGAEHLLRIVSGLHAGASRELAEREMLLVGSGDDCDIVLADQGVANHHALVSLVDGSFQLRALDAPLKLDNRLLHPGDPVELGRVCRVGLGEAAFAFGHRDDPGWLELTPAGGDFESPMPSSLRIPFARRLPMIAAIAVLSLASLAIFAAVMPQAKPKVDVEGRLQALARENRVAERRIERDINGRPVLAGIVHNAAAAERIRQQLQDEGIDAGLSLRSGDDLVEEVVEVLRGEGYAVRGRYLGGNDVEVTGHFDDFPAFENFVKSRAMNETGVRRIVPVNLAEASKDAEAPAPDAHVRVLAIVRGDNAHVVGDDGRHYEVGAEIPGRGTLVSIGEYAHIVDTDGNLHKLQAEAPARTETEDADDGEVAAQEPAPQRPRSRAYAAEQARAQSRMQ